MKKNNRIQFPGLLKESLESKTPINKTTTVKAIESDVSSKKYDFTQESLNRSAEKIVENMMKQKLKMIESSIGVSKSTLTPPTTNPTHSVGVKKGQQQTKNRNTGAPVSPGKPQKL